MKSIIRYGVAIAVIFIVIAGAVLSATPWLRRIHSIEIERGAVVIETSPDGRLANPYRTHTSIPLAKAGILIGVTCVVLIALAIAVFQGVARH